MHICMVAFSDLRFDYRIFREATSLHQAGHRVSIISTAFSPDPLVGWGNFEIHLIPIDRNRSLRLLYPLFWREAGRLLLDIEADVYHVHDLDALGPGARAAKRRDRPLVYDSHEFWIEQSSLVNRPIMRGFWSQLEKRLIRQVDRAIAVSQSIADSLEERYGLEHVSVLRNVPLYRPRVESDLIRQVLNIESGRPIVLYQGGFLTDNGLQEQIHAAKDFGDAAFVLIGSGPCEEELKEIVRQNRLEERVYFIDRVPFNELHSYTCSADIGLCLIKGTGKSFYYSLPNKLFEYMMAGLPVLASDFPEMQRVIDETGTGTSVNPSDIRAISQAVCAILADPKLRLQQREAAQQAARHFNWEQEAETLVQLYDEI
ncbi:MAG: glycosyltransferase family 4 protein [Candidatus Latescibacterota bacterium]|jgi:glycosyltransferase involved in cell wall biosynthesis